MVRKSLHPGGDRGTHEEPIIEKLEEEVFNPDAAKVEDNPFPEELITQDYNSMTVEELKTLCRERGLAVSGNKAELIARLEAHDDTPAENAAVEESVEDTPVEDTAVSEDKPEEGEVSESGGNEQQ